MKKKLIKTFLVLIVAGIIFGLYGYISSMRIVVNHHEVERGFSLKIAQISDTHFDDKFNEDKYMTIVDTINEEEVDVVFFTGDLFEINTISDELEEDIIRYLSKIDCIDKFAVLGNHDYSHGEDFTAQVVTILELSGFIILQNEYKDRVFNSDHFRFIGLDDLMYGDSNYIDILDNVDSEYINIVLSHEPDAFEDVINMDIVAMFAGHSHGGQVRLPFIGAIVTPPGATYYPEHHYEFEDKDLFVSFGIGENLIKVRFLNPRQYEIYNYS